MQGSGSAQVKAGRGGFLRLLSCGSDGPEEAGGQNFQIDAGIHGAMIAGHTSKNARCDREGCKS